MIDGIVPETFLYSQDLSSYTKFSLKYERFGIGGIHFLTLLNSIIIIYVLKWQSF